MRLKKIRALQREAVIADYEGAIAGENKSSTRRKAAQALYDRAIDEEDRRSTKLAARSGLSAESGWGEDNRPAMPMTAEDMRLKEEQGSRKRHRGRAAKDLVPTAQMSSPGAVSEPDQIAEPDPLAEWVFLQHCKPPLTFEKLCETAKKDPALIFTEDGLRKARHQVYFTESHAPPKNGWPLRPPYAARWNAKQRGK